jgi:branched-subunit amino acid aminotransferase/4-amino-4-deoxychorismate lyase
MSDQGPLSDGRGAADFGLIETLLWTRGDDFFLLAEHLERLAGSSAALGFAFDAERTRNALECAVAEAARGDVGRLRVRLVLSRDGAIETSATPIEAAAPGTLWRTALARRRFDSADPLLRHKTTRRALYEEELAAAANRCGADEALFLNERDEVCESARCNLFVERGGFLLTPPLSCGLLPGTLRAHLLSRGRAKEALLRLEDLSEGFYLGNSVRGLVRATLSPC